MSESIQIVTWEEDEDSGQQIVLFSDGQTWAIEEETDRLIGPAMDDLNWSDLRDRSEPTGEPHIDMILGEVGR